MQYQELKFWQLEEVAKTGNAQAQFELGQRYDTGTGGARESMIYALYWLNKSVKQGHAEARLRRDEIRRENNREWNTLWKNKKSGNLS